MLFTEYLIKWKWIGSDWKFWYDKVEDFTTIWLPKVWKNLNRYEKYPLRCDYMSFLG